MFVETFALGAGTSGLFQSRAFVPAFLTALTLRWKQGEQLGFSVMVNNHPVAMTSNTVLVILGLLAVAEILAQKNPDFRAVLNDIDRYLKAGMSYVTYLGITAATSATVSITPTTPGIPGAPAPLQSGFTAWGAGLFIAALTFWLAGLRGDAVQLLVDADEDDDLGIQWLISLAEDLWAIFGLFLLLLIPIVGLTLIALVSGLIWLTRWRAHRREEAAKVACPQCGTMMYQSALACPGCKQPNVSPHDVGFLGTAIDRPADDLQHHAYRLVSKKRCPVCAAHWPQRSVDQTCEACGHRLFGDRAFADAYMQQIDGRIPKVLLVCLLFGFVPIVGAIPGVIYMRFTLVGPYRQYLSRLRSFFLRWGIRLLMFVMLATQWIPVIGSVTVPLLALISHRVYRQAFVGRLANEPISS